MGTRADPRHLPMQLMFHEQHNCPSNLPIGLQNRTAKAHLANHAQQHQCAHGRLRPCSSWRRGGGLDETAGCLSKAAPGQFKRLARLDLR